MVRNYSVRMGTGDDPRPTRRTVLKATATALGTGLAATGTAAAECYQHDTATLQYDYVLLEGGDGTVYEPCVGDAVGPTVEAGTQFQVYDTCTESDSSAANSYVKVLAPDSFQYRWIDTRAVEC